MRWSADIVLRPLIIVLNGSGVLLMRALGMSHSEGHSYVHSPEEIKYLIMRSHEGGLIDDQEHHLLDRALRFDKLRVGEIVRPRTKVVATDIETPVDDILRMAAQSDFTRIPIYEGNIDNVIGFIHLKELFQLSYKAKATDVRTILREVSFIPETAYLDDVWTILNEKESHLAIVFDEYGGTLGLITREDLLEELFGEVQDEFDQSETAPVKKISEHVFQVRGDVSIAYLNDRFNLSIQSHDAYTIGGFFLNQLGHMPTTGDEVVIDNVRLEATVVKDRAVEAILLSIAPRDQQSEDN
jgi:CBS domain containing-hemolysin-like protein